MWVLGQRSRNAVSPDYYWRPEAVQVGESRWLVLLNLGVQRKLPGPAPVRERHSLVREYFCLLETDLSYQVGLSIRRG